MMSIEGGVSLVRRSGTRDIENFLEDMRKAISNGKWHLQNRTESMATIADLGMTIDDVENELFLLNYSECIAGPEPDRDRPGTDDFWMFEKYLHGTKIYIKTKVLYQVDKSVLVISFHKSRYQ